MNFLKCDEPDCDTRVFVGEIQQHHVDTPCPSCGANLLTQEDYDGWTAMQLGEVLPVLAGLGGTSHPEDLELVEVSYHKHHLDVVATGKRPNDH